MVASVKDRPPALQTQNGEEVRRGLAGRAWRRRGQERNFPSSRRVSETSNLHPTSPTDY